jgi:SAM-dependent methyltransferase
MKSALQREAEALARSGVFLGGPVEVFEWLGRHQLILLLEHGLMPASKVLDIGCGCLRAGYWLIHFLQPGCYFGIEPNTSMLDAGRKALFTQELLAHKRPTFSADDDFDLSVFGTVFDFVLARSIWTHAAPRQIQRMLDGFVAHTTSGAVFLASYRRARRTEEQYAGCDWVGRSHASDTPGMVGYTLEWIERECSERNLRVTELKPEVQGQWWLRIAKPE